MDGWMLQMCVGWKTQREREVEGFILSLSVPFTNKTKGKEMMDSDVRLRIELLFCLIILFD